MPRRSLLLTGVALAAVLPVASAAAPERSAPGTDGLSAGQLVGQRLVAGFPGTDIPNSVRRRVREGRLAGVILFADNLPSRSAGRRLIHDLQSIHRPRGLKQPLLIMVDQEGGEVKRLDGAPCCSAKVMGKHGKGFSRRQGAATGRNLDDVGVNVNLAPVLDVGRRDSAIWKEHRSFGLKKQRVAGTANAFANGLASEHVAPTAKHFPGLGAARENTDFHVQRVTLSQRKIRAHDEFPYKRYIGDGAKNRMVMLSTAIYTHFSNRPAALSRKLATGELRERLGFEGVSISDALGTVSARDVGGIPKVARKTAKAGTDLLLFTSTSEVAKAADALKKALDKGRISKRSFRTSVARVLQLRANLRR